MTKQRVVLELQSGAMSGKRISFEDKAVCVLGRAKDCNLVLDDPKVSRYHCLLEIDPPKIAVRDFSSLNGTFINDILVGKRQGGQTADGSFKDASNLKELQNGDILRLASSCRIRIYVENCQSVSKQVPTVSPPVAAENEIIPGYRLIRMIGKGSMGVVSLVEEISTGKRLALKTIREELKDTPEARAFFLREAEIGPQLSHPNIARQYAATEIQGNNCILTDYYPLGSLDDFLAKHPMSIPDTARLGLQLLAGLAYLHQASVHFRQEDGNVSQVYGIVHRDIKPANIFAAEENGRLCLKIADFGLSLPCGFQRTETFIGQVRGTYGFMPRQQVLNAGSAAPEIDVWAAAATIYYLLTGYYPRDLDGRDPIECILTRSAVPVRTRKPEIPKVLADVIDLALQDSPDFAVRTTEEFYQQLDMAVDWM